MVQLIVSYAIIIFMLFNVFRLFLYYAFGRSVETTALSPEFVQHFYHELRDFNVPVKALVRMQPLPMGIAVDSRPIMAIGGQIVINEHACYELPADQFAAGLEYEYMRIRLSIVWYNFVTIIFTLGCIPMVYLLAHAVHGVVFNLQSGFLLTVMRLADMLLSFLSAWPLLQLPIIFSAMVYCIERPLARYLVRAAYEHGKYANKLLDYLEYLEPRMSAELNQVLDLTYQRNYLEELIADEGEEESDE